MELAYLARARAMAIRHAIVVFLHGSKLRLLVVCCLVVFFWGLMLGML